ncbi:O-antigen ligase family protein [Limnobacter litoralis]|uniref:O-antigen ligase family protein n=1 Tax=Limnobacter litoralis TaxID=481366 RepID=UPI0024E0CE15|nr:O-antigen ligase family protein [Limnobacter litoralis]
MKADLLRRPAFWLALSAFFLPIKPAPVNLFLLVAVVLVLGQEAYRKAIASCLFSPVGYSILALVAWLMASTLLPDSSWQSANLYLVKYLRLMLIPVLATAVQQDSDRWKILDAFALGVLVSVLASYAVAVGLLPWPADATSPVYFKLHITHNFFIALAAPYVVWRLFERWSCWSAPVRFLALSGLTISLYNFLFMVEGRSGWLAIACIPAVVALRKLGLKKGGVVALALALGALAIVAFSPFVHERVATALHEVQQWHDGLSVAQDTSMGRRLIFWSYSIRAIEHAPLFGHGLGGFELAITPYAMADHFFIFNNPHNQYLLFTVQGGLLALFLYFTVLWALLCRSEGPAPLVLTCLVASYALLNLLNSFHFDFAEGLLFIIATAALAFRANASSEKAHERP